MFIDSENILKLRYQDEIGNLPKGISYCAKQNVAYRSLIEVVSISKYSNEEIFKEWIRKGLQALV